jgi:CheY-like chemotaxis protein
MLLQNKRIFAVEDNLENRIITLISLTRQGAEVEFDRWGLQTISKLRAFAPVDVILLDLMLGHGITGYDIFDQIRAIPEFAHVPIVAVSASDPNAAIPRTKAKGFAAYIAKPIDDDLFPTQIAKILEKQPVWHAG